MSWPIVLASSALALVLTLALVARCDCGALWNRYYVDSYDIGDIMIRLTRLRGA